MTNTSLPQTSDRIPLKADGRILFVSAHRINWIESAGNYVEFVIQPEGERVLVRETLSSFEKSLDPERFVRIHRSYIVNFERVVRIEPYGKDSRLAILADGTRLPVSRAGYARLKTLLDDRA